MENNKETNKKKMKELKADEVRWTCSDDCFSFRSTTELSKGNGVIGQERAIEAIEFGMGIDSKGFNIYAMGPTGVGRTSIVKEFIDRKAQEKPVPDDWCYIYNFDTPNRPIAVHMPAGKGRTFRDDMEKLKKNLKEDIPKALEHESYEKDRNRLMNEMQRQQTEELNRLEQKAQKQGFTIQRGAQGFVIMPLKEDGSQMSSQELAQLSEEDRNKIQNEGQSIQDELQEVLRKIRTTEGETKEKLEELQKNTILFAIEHHLEGLKEKYGEYQRIDEYLDDLKNDVVSNAENIAQMEQSEGRQVSPQQQQAAAVQQENILNRYTVNLIVDNSDTQGAPVISEMRPTHKKLIGKLERKAQLGMLYTDFNMIKPGVLHQANGGYLVLEAMHLFQYPFAYNVLKHALKEGEAKITDQMEVFQAISTESLDPEPIPLDIKVILIGNPRVYFILQQMDEEFQELFKVKADFNSFMDRSQESIDMYAGFLAGRCQEEGWKPFDNSGVARMVELGIELTQDQEKLTTKFADVCDVAREANYIAEQRKGDSISRNDVYTAIMAKRRRSDRIEEYIQEIISRGDIYIDTDQRVTGQVNGLSVVDLGDYSFGRPSRITAQTFVGRSGVVNIDREADMSGPVHNKGVLILSGYMNGTYGRWKPVSLSASLVFEQLYSGIDGDSASSTELYALLSSLADISLKQNIAVTGSVDQRGAVQPVGGVSQKVEGFYDICKAIGLTGEQGVIIPQQNVKNLMLREDVVKAIEEGQFHIYPVSTVAEGMEILTHKPFGERQDDGSFPEGTVNYAVEQTLLQYAKAWDMYSKDKSASQADKN
ncbi:MAG TPA: ATP-binding protein [Clostridia bacterium]|nr:ATP-binding protein [Clostridia bacterium]